VSRKRCANFLRLKKDGGNLAAQHQDDNPEVDSIETNKKVYTKIYIRAPARLILSKHEHLAHRIYAATIEDELGQGERYLTAEFSPS
jgi:hypothetical protein